MSGESKQTFQGKATFGTTNILGMGTWSHSGMARGMIQDVEFGDDVTDYLYDMLEGGKVSFSGNFKKDDTTGQDILLTALYERGALTTLRFYVDSVSYYTPNSTSAAGGKLPAGMPVSNVKVESVDVDFSGPSGTLGKISFVVQVCGVLRLI